MQEAREENKERRDASWAGRRGQAERAALVEMNSAIQGMNTAEYAVRCEFSPPLLLNLHCHGNTLGFASAALS